MKLASCLKYCFIGIGICLTLAVKAGEGGTGKTYGVKMGNSTFATDTLPRNSGKSEPENNGSLVRDLQGNSDQVKGKLKNPQIKEVPRARPQAVPRIVTPPGLMKPKIIKPKIITKGIGR